MLPSCEKINSILRSSFSTEEGGEDEEEKGEEEEEEGGFHYTRKQS